MAGPVTYSSGYSAPFYAGSGTADASVVPGKYSVAINGHPYLLYTDPQSVDSYGDFFKEESLPLLRAQADQGKTPGEQSIDPRQFWRRSQDTWHKGAGQSVLDRNDSDPARFNTSKGINPWTRYQLTLLPATTAGPLFAATGFMGVAAAGGLYYGATSSTTTKFFDGTATTTNLTGGPGAAPTGMATNGGQVWAGFGASGIYQVTAPATAVTSYVTGTVGIVGFAKGRLLAANGAALYNPVAAGALPAAFYTHPDANFAWRAFAEGNACIYAAGDTGSRSWIYRITVQPDGSALTVPVVAATLPTGEKVQSLIGYLGFVVIGTDKGVRFATAETSGDLTLGALVPTPQPVYALEAQDRFVWFGWSNYDSSTSGLGRFDLTTINDGLTPAYASDLMTDAGTLGAVRAVATVGTGTSARRIFLVDGFGPYQENTSSSVASGTLTTGQITYGIADPKVAIFVDLKHAPLPADASIAASASFDRGASLALGSSSATGSVSPSESLSAQKRRSEEVELTFALAWSGVQAPTLTRWTLLSYPAPAGTSMVTLPLQLHSDAVTYGDVEVAMDTYREYRFLVALHNDREIATVQIGRDSFEGTLEDFTWIPYDTLADRKWWNGCFVAKFRKIT